MSSNRGLQSIGLLLFLGTIAALGAGALGCGHKAPPFPPPLENPARTADLSIQQRGQAAVLSFTYPQTTIAGGLLEQLERVEVYRTKKSVAAVVGGEAPDEGTEATEPDEGTEATEPDEGAEATEPDEGAEDAEPDEGAEATEPSEGPESALPAQPLEVLAAADPAEFVATAQLVDSFDDAAIEQATHGGKLTFRIALDQAGHEETAHTFAVKTYASEKLVSSFSNLVTLVQRVPPPPPTDFQLTAEADGIKLAWATVEDPENAPIAIGIYRRPTQSRLYGQPLARLEGSAGEYLDRSAVFGERYIYAVTALGHETPIVESFFGGEREIDYADRFAPAPPTQLIALAEAGRVRLLWNASMEEDVVGYVVFRRQARGNFRQLTDQPILDVEYSDRTVETATTYDYRIAAVDRAGNQSEQGASVIARVP
ncbi:MAG: hypothetical protein IH936_00055 [Acidobacteria bacterium]|nr:hypothetical protein [Acidobacteriota bacterium]